MLTVWWILALSLHSVTAASSVKFSGVTAAFINLLQRADVRGFLNSLSISVSSDWPFCDVVPCIYIITPLAPETHR